MEKPKDEIPPPCCPKIMAERSPLRMFKFIKATVCEEWMASKELVKHDFLDFLQDIGCKIQLEKQTINIECSFDQLLSIQKKFDEENKSCQAEYDIESPEASQIIKDEVILDKDVWDYMNKIYGSEIAIQQEKCKVSLEACITTEEMTTIILKTELESKNPHDIMNVHRKLLEMKDYISSLESVVACSVIVERIKCRPRLVQSQVLDGFIKENCPDVIIQEFNEGLKIIGPRDSCRKVKMKLSSKSFEADDPLASRASADTKLTADIRGNNIYSHYAERFGGSLGISFKKNKCASSGKYEKLASIEINKTLEDCALGHKSTGDEEREYETNEIFVEDFKSVRDDKTNITDEPELIDSHNPNTMIAPNSPEPPGEEASQKYHEALITKPSKKPLVKAGPKARKRLPDVAYDDYKYTKSIDEEKANMGVNLKLLHKEKLEYDSDSDEEDFEIMD